MTLICMCSDSNFSWGIGLQQFPRPKVIYSATDLEIIFQATAEIFLLAVALFRFVFQISSIVIEKEHKLRQVLLSFHCLFIKDVFDQQKNRRK